jgi:predicted lipoprotein with Yx(FWY)xxD motif
VEQIMNSFKRLIAGSIAVAFLAAACSGAATYTPTAAVAGATAAPVATPAPVTGTPAPAGATVMSKSLGSQTILVAGSNGMTVYTFTKDTAGGPSTCSGGCLTKWPALTIAAGAAPTGGDGVTGKLGTITRPDDGTLQVTYNGLPLYFYQGDSAPGDTNGSYTNWNLVKP